MKNFLIKNLPSSWYSVIRRIFIMFRNIFSVVQFLYKKIIGNRLLIVSNQSKKVRNLEIGPGPTRLSGFETLNIVAGTDVDYVFDAARPLPFKANSFDLIYCSHILEHIPWYETKKTLKEWYRITKSGGKVEIWVPDAMVILEQLVVAENGVSDSLPDDWSVLNPDKNRYLWVNGRLIYGARTDYPSWHKALFTAGHLKKLLLEVGFSEVSKMEKSELRGKDHGIIDLGIKATKV